MSNFYEYESVQSNISHGRQTSQTSIGSGGHLGPGGMMQPPGLPMYDTRGDPRTMSPGRHEMPPPRHIPGQHYSQPGKQGINTLSVAPIQTGGKYGYYATTARGGSRDDYEEHRKFAATLGPTMTDYDDPYGRVMVRRPSHPGTVTGHTVQPPHPSHRMQHSLSHPRIQSHQVPNNHMYKVPSTLPPGSKV